MSWPRMHWVAGAGGAAWPKLNPCVDVRDLGSREALEAVCYPRIEGACYDRLHTLQSIGVRGVCVRGHSRLVTGIGILGKGHASIVSAFLADWGVVAVKSRRVDGKRKSLVKEAVRARSASQAGIAPKIYYYDDDIIVMEYISGPSLAEVIQIYGGLPNWAIYSALESARILDDIGLLHLELHRPWRNVFYRATQSNYAYIIDYESTSRGCGNVVKVLSGLSRYSMKLHMMTSNLAIRRMFKAYKKQECPSSIYQRILGHVKKALEME